MLGQDFHPWMKPWSILSQRIEGGIFSDQRLFLVAIGYHGKNFHGSQIQPKVRTVQGTLIDALKKSAGGLKVAFGFSVGPTLE